MLKLTLVGKQSLIDRLDWMKTHNDARLTKALNRAAIIVQDAAKQNVARGHPENLRIGSGILRASLTHIVEPGAMRARVGTPLVYGPIHEFGGEIKPKNKPWLVFFVPSKWAQAQTRTNKAGREVNRFTPNQIKQKGMGYWVRTKKVTIPKRPYLGPALAAKHDEIRAEFEGVLRELIEGH